MCISLKLRDNQQLEATVRLKAFIITFLPKQQQQQQQKKSQKKGSILQSLRKKSGETSLEELFFMELLVISLSIVDNPVHQVFCNFNK